MNWNNIDLPLRLMKFYTYLGDILIDPFMGTGTSCWVAKKLGRKCIGIEIEERYCKIAVDRLRQSVMRLNA